MGKLDDMLAEHMGKLPRLFAREIVRDKLGELGFGSNERLVEAVVDKLLEGSTDDEREANSRYFELDDDLGVDGEFLIEFTPADVARLETMISDLEEELPDILVGAAKSAAKVMLRDYERRWAAWYAHNLNEFDGFRLRLQTRWGKGFDALRMLIEMSREIGISYQRRVSRRRSQRKAHIGPALHHLHVRALQISSEIMVLMENGFADGAMARWRTLHEVTCVAMLLDEGGDALAERYLLHEFVEARKALRAFQAAQPLLGHKPFPKREAARIERDYQELVTKFGKPFGTDYGWAADHLGEAQPTFMHIEKAVGRQMMRSHYKMASNNVHAGTKGIAYRLSSLHDHYPGVAGASNVGFVEPGQNLSISLLHMTMLLVPKSGSLDDLTEMAMLDMLQKRVPAALVRAQRAIRREDEAKGDAARSATRARRDRQSSRGGTSSGSAAA